MNREGKLWKKISSAPLIKLAGGKGREGNHRFVIHNKGSISAF